MANQFYIAGIQQVGIGNPDVASTWAYYRKNFGFDVPVFEEEAEAGLMLPYTGGQPQKRNATLVLNMNGGGGLEIWQYTERELIWPKQPALPGDLGIHTLKIKTQDVAKAYADCQAKGLDLVGTLQKRNGKDSHFLVRDLHGNMLEIVQSQYWYQQKNGLYGGVAGAALGVTDLDRSTNFYKVLLGFDRVIFEEEGEFDELSQWSGQKERFKRIILERTGAYKGAFAPLLGPAQIELIQALDRQPVKLFEGRFWGDPGYIHLCFDVNGMDHLKAKSESLGHPFTVDSANSFDMGEAAGRFAYIEDPDGSLIEFVETHKVPIMKKLNWYLNLKKRRPEKPLPRWMINAMAIGRVKD
jgi:catechol 2,3-dioxygenase-like lactoylglutathione lyase family enzyme